MKARPAFTLIEVVITLTIGSSVALLGVGLVHRAMELRKTTSARTQFTRSVDRWIAQFRRDVWLSTSAHAESPEELTLLQTDGTEIRYAFEGRTLLRNQRQATQDNQDRMSGMDDPYSPSFQCHFELSTTHAALAFAAATNSNSDSPPLERRASAAIGRWSTSEKTASLNQAGRLSEQTADEWLAQREAIGEQP